MMSEFQTKKINLRKLSKPKNQPNPNIQRKGTVSHLDPIQTPDKQTKNVEPPPSNPPSPTHLSIPENFEQHYSDLNKSTSFSADLQRIADKITSYRYDPWNRRLNRYKPY